MKIKILGIFTILIVMLSLAGCGNQDKKTDSSSDKIQVITTYSILYDIAKNVGGDRVEIHSLAPVGSNRR